MIETPLFDNLFLSQLPPVAFAPGSSTSKAAADKIAPSVGGKRERVLALFRAGLRLTADEVAEAIDGRLLVWRPRVTDCRNAGLLVPTGETKPNAFGNDCDVLRLATRDEMTAALRLHDAGSGKRVKAMAAWVRRELEAA